MSVYMHCNLCRPNVPPGAKPYEVAKLAVIVEQSPVRGKSTISVKCLVHGRLLFQAMIEANAPQSTTGLGITQVPLI